jgi:hypothetical protein
VPYFFLAELLLLELDLLELLPLFELELFDPPDLEADLAILCSPLNSALNRQSKQRFRMGRGNCCVHLLFCQNK